MPFFTSLRVLVFFLLSFAAHIFAQSTSSPSPSPSTTAPPTSPSSSPPITKNPSPRPTPTSTPPDVYLHVPELHVGRIELDVEALHAEINLRANVAGLVQVNAGVQVNVQKVNLTIADVGANVELVVRLGRLVEIVERVFDSLNLNPLLVGLIANATDAVGEVGDAVDGLLGSVAHGGKRLRFSVDNLGNIVQEVVGGPAGGLAQIIGNYQLNMTQVGDGKQVGNGLVLKTFSYEPLSALVDIVFNAAGQVVKATVQRKSGRGSSSSAASSGPEAMPVKLPDSSDAGASTA